MGFANQRLAYAGIRAEAVVGTLDVAGDYDRLAATSITFTPQYERISVYEIGRGEPSTKRTVSNHVTGTITYPLRFADVDALFAYGLRDAAMPSEVAVAKTISTIVSGTHLDGTTGPQIKVLAATGEFDALNAASSGSDLEGIYLWIYGTTNDDWDQIGPKRAKAGSPRIDGADSVIDLDQRDFLATTGWGSAFTGQVGVAVTVDAGAALKNQPVVAAGETTYSIIGYMPDVAKYVYLTRVQFSPPAIAFNNRGLGQVSQNFIGNVYGVLTTTNPNTGNSIVDSNSWYQPIMGGPDCDHITLATDTQSVELAGCAVTTLNFNNAADWQPINNTLGSTALCGTIGPAMDFEASFDYYVDSTADATSISKALQTIAAAATREKASLAGFFYDTDGNQMVLAYQDGEPAPSTVSSVGADSDTAAGGSFTLGAHSRTSTSRTFLFQRRLGGESEVS